MDVSHMQGPVTDTGTGAYPGPPEEVTYGEEHDPNPTGAVDGPPAEVTVTSLEHEEGPTGAHPGPEAETTITAWPAPDEKRTKTSKASKKAVTGDEAGVENKAVTGDEAATKKDD